MTILSKNFSKVLNRFNRNNKAGVRNRDSGGGSTGVPTLRRNTASNNAILMQVLEIDLVMGTTLNLMQRTKEFNAVNVKVSAISRLNV